MEQQIVHHYSEGSVIWKQYACLAAEGLTLHKKMVWVTIKRYMEHDCRQWGFANIEDNMQDGKSTAGHLVQILHA